MSTPKKHRYYFFTATDFKELLLDGDDEAINVGKSDAACVRVLRAKDSTVIHEKPAEQPKTP